VAAEDGGFYEHDVVVTSGGIAGPWVRNIRRGAVEGRRQHHHPAAGPAPDLWYLKPGPHPGPQAQRGGPGRQDRAPSFSNKRSSINTSTMCILGFRAPTASPMRLDLPLSKAADQLTRRKQP